MAKPIKEATIRRIIHARSMKESMTGANAQTTYSQRTSRGTMVGSQLILREPKPRRKHHSRRNPRTKPTSFGKKQSQAREIIMNLC